MIATCKCKGFITIAISANQKPRRSKARGLRCRGMLGAIPPSHPPYLPRYLPVLFGECLPCHCHCLAAARVAMRLMTNAAKATANPTLHVVPSRGAFTSAMPFGLRPACRRSPPPPLCFPPRALL
jgi:hypothetical protein